MVPLSKLYRDTKEYCKCSPMFNAEITSTETFLNSWRDNIHDNIQLLHNLRFRVLELEADTSRFRSLVSSRIAQIESLTKKIGGGKYEDATKEFVAVLGNVNTEAAELEEDLNKISAPIS
ncbi:MAG: hypothetical protein Q9226_007737 [Calogaya cf. arnoldii]